MSHYSFKLQSLSQNLKKKYIIGNLFAIFVSFLIGLIYPVILNLIATSMRFIGLKKRIKIFENGEKKLKKFKNT